MTPAEEPAAAGALPSPRLGHAALAFDAEVLELRARRDPGNLALLVELARTYARLGRHRDVRALDQRLVAACPGESRFHYNLACSLALTGDLAGACDELLAALDRGYRDLAFLRRDPDLAALRRDPRFARVEARLASLREPDGRPGPSPS